MSGVCTSKNFYLYLLHVHHLNINDYTNNETNNNKKKTENYFAIKFQTMISSDRFIIICCESFTIIVYNQQQTLISFDLLMVLGKAFLAQKEKNEKILTQNLVTVRNFLEKMPSQFPFCTLSCNIEQILKKTPNERIARNARKKNIFKTNRKKWNETMKKKTTK